MFYPNGNGNGPRPLSRKKTVQLMVALTILAWATQTLFQQWGFGQTIDPDATANQTAPANMPTDASEKFVPGSAGNSIGATLEFRAEATIIGNEVKLKQICRWADSEAPVFAPISDLVVFRIAAKSPFRSISMGDVKSTLRDAGVNIAAINFVGATACTIDRSDSEVNGSDSLQDWINAKQNNANEVVGLPPAGAAEAPTTQPAATFASDEKPFRNVREQLTADLSTRLNIPISRVQMTFHPQDEKVLSLSEPHFRARIEPFRLRNLGEVGWNVTIISDDDTTQRTTIEASARAWQEQVIVARPLGYKQLITDADVAERKVLVDKLLEDTILTKTQIVGQQASRELKPGTIFTGKLVDPIQLVRVGQLVTIVFKQGGVELKSAARAMESGSFGQTIKVKSESTRDIFQVVCTGPQTASMNPMSPAMPPAMAPTVASAGQSAIQPE